MAPFYKLFLSIASASLITLHSSMALAEIETMKALSPQELFKIAITTGQVEELHMLVEDGIDINSPLNDGAYPLHMAIINNQEAVTKALLDMGANIQVLDKATNATPLHIAALYDRGEIAKLLIQKGANTNTTMKFGITPILVAAKFNHGDVLKILLENKANPNQADQDGFTSLHFAAQHGNVSMAQLLIQKGAKLHPVEKTHSATPIMLARENKHMDVVRLLEDADVH